MTKQACLGTREIRLRSTGRKAGPTTTENGMLLLFLPGQNSRSTGVPIDDNENECSASIEYQHEAASTATALDVMVTNGSITYRGQIDLNNVRTKGRATNNNNKSRSAAHKSSGHEEKRNQVAAFILHQNPDVTVLYELVTPRSNDDGTGSGPRDYGEDRAFVKMIIKQSLGSVVRVVWSGHLFASTTRDNKEQRQQQQRNDNNSNSNNDNNAMEFIQAIRSELLRSNAVTEQLRQNESKMTSQMLSWKDTADKMGDTWQEEKDGLLNRFLVLLNRVKGELRAAHTQLKEEKEKNRPQKQHERTPLIPLAGQKIDHLVDYEDEHDLERYDPELVKRLASQRSKRTGPVQNAQQAKKRQRTATQQPESTEAPTKHTTDRSILVSQQEESLCARAGPTLADSQIMGQSQSSIRKNPHTGAIEMWTAESIFSQDIYTNTQSALSNVLNGTSKQVQHPAEEDKDSIQNTVLLDRVLNTTSKWMKEDPVREKVSSNKKAFALNKTCTDEDGAASKDTYGTDEDSNDDSSNCSEALL